MINLDKKCKKTNQKYLELLDITKQIGNDRAKMIQFNPIIDEKILEIERETGDLDTIYTYQKLGFEGEDLEKVMGIKEAALANCEKRKEKANLWLKEAMCIVLAFPDLKQQIFRMNKENLINLYDFFREDLLSISNGDEDTRQTAIDDLLYVSRLVLAGTVYEDKLDKVVNQLINKDYIFDQKAMDKGGLGSINEWVRKIVIRKDLENKDYLTEMAAKNGINGFSGTILRIMQEEIAINLKKMKKDNLDLKAQWSLIEGIISAGVLRGKNLTMEIAMKRYIKHFLYIGFKDNNATNHSIAILNLG